MTQKPYYYKIIFKNGTYTTAEHGWQIDLYVDHYIRRIGIDRIEVITQQSTQSTQSTQSDDLNLRKQS